MIHSHPSLLLGSLATPEDRHEAAALASAPCAACSAPAAPPPPALPLPPEVALALAHDGSAGARRAQAALDAMGIGPEFYPGIVAQLASQPGTCVGWRRWWAGWRGGVLLGATTIHD